MKKYLSFGAAPAQPGVKDAGADPCVRPDADPKARFLPPPFLKLTFTHK